jgi:hypothetical protein
MKALSGAMPRVLGVCAVLVFLGGCGAPQSQVAGTGTVPYSAVTAGHHGSWVNPRPKVRRRLFTFRAVSQTIACSFTLIPGGS